MKYSLERSRSSKSVEHSKSSNQMGKKDRDELKKLLKGMTAEEIIEVKRVVDKIEPKR